MRLFLFPELPTKTDGYGIAVYIDLQSFEYREGDFLVFFTDDASDFPAEIKRQLLEKKAELIVVERNRSWQHIFRELIALRHPSHFYGHSYHVQMKLPEIEWEYIFCGDVIFYYHVRAFLKYKSILVRFHNLWSKLVWRARWKSVRTGWRFAFLNLWLGKRLELRIVHDSNCQKAFITESDLDFYEILSGDRNLELMPVIEKVNIPNEDLSFNISEGGTLNLVWFGTVVSHNVYGIKWFLKEVYEPLKKQGCNVAFHLFGRHTEKFDRRELAIYGHGKFNGDGLPLDGNGLFINPDLLGGGVKLKMQFMLESGLHVLSTPFGMDGYEHIDGSKFLTVENSEDWQNHILTLLKPIHGTAKN